jgi:hypothetical protein
VGLLKLHIDNGLVADLKAAGHGIWVAGQQVAIILMYADDMVMLASTQAELKKMSAIASAFAKRNRFKFNGEKSRVMHFNARAPERARCLAEQWELFGEPVKVVYVYLGTNTPADGLNWRAHVDGGIAKAKRRSADLLWVCRGDMGIRPRTVVSLWKSLVRPLLEYGSELWGENYGGPGGGGRAGRPDDVLTRNSRPARERQWSRRRHDPRESWLRASPHALGQAATGLLASRFRS